MRFRDWFQDMFPFIACATMIGAFSTYLMVAFA